jgi:hypothetical protein
MHNQNQKKKKKNLQRRSYVNRWSFDQPQWRRSGDKVLEIIGIIEIRARVGSEKRFCEDWWENGFKSGSCSGGREIGIAREWFSISKEPSFLSFHHCFSSFLLFLFHLRLSVWELREEKWKEKEKGRLSKDEAPISKRCRCIYIYRWLVVINHLRLL